MSEAGRQRRVDRHGIFVADLRLWVGIWKWPAGPLDNPSFPTVTTKAAQSPMSRPGFSEFLREPGPS